MMLNKTQTSYLSALRKGFYEKDTRYGEVFDTNFMDTISHPDISFTECVELSKKDTEQYIFLDEGLESERCTRLN